MVTLHETPQCLFWPACAAETMKAVLRAKSFQLMPDDLQVIQGVLSAAQQNISVTVQSNMPGLLSCRTSHRILAIF